jgi:hypothetical protein
MAAMQRASINTGVPTSCFQGVSRSGQTASYFLVFPRNLHYSGRTPWLPTLVAFMVAPASTDLMAVLCLCLVTPFLAFLYFYVTVITLLRYVYLSTVDGTARNCSGSPVRRIILAACTAIDELQRMRLMSTHGSLPAHIWCRSSVQILHSKRAWRTVCRPKPHWHSSVCRPC